MRARGGRYGGAYLPKEPDEPVDPKPSIDAKCAPGCKEVWAAYGKCEVRIEEKVRASPYLCTPWLLVARRFFHPPSLAPS